MRLLIVDHNDSFTFNLRDAFRVLGAEVTVVSHPPAAVQGYDALVLSPGPGRPADYPETRALLDLWPAERPLLGVCLGMQLLNEWSGGETIHSPQVVHGKISPIHHDGRGIFSNLSSPCMVMRYHSLACKITSPEWTVCARTADEVPMAMRHRTRPWWGVQFHPESFMTPDGQKMLNHFVMSDDQSGCRTPSGMTTRI